MTPPVNPESVSVQAGVLGENELRMKVAELCGWADVEIGLGPFSRGQLYGNAPDCRKYPTVKNKVPDYPNDLNACAELEKPLHADKEKWDRYTDLLDDICYGTKPFTDPIHATARQRCLAFVKTMKGESVREGG